MSTVGYATLQIVPSMRGVQAELTRQMAGIAPNVGRQAGQQAGGGFLQGFVGGITPLKASVAGAGLAVAAGLGAAINVTRNFEAQISAVGAVSGATAGDLEALREKAIQLGADTAFSASESASAMEELVKAGLSVEDVLGGAADATVALAAAGGVDLARAAEVASNAMNVFNLSAAEMPKIADLVAAAANNSAIDVNDFAFSLQMSGAVANLVGLDFEDLAVGITAMGNAGIKGSDAGTSLKVMLMRLEPSTKKARAEMKDLGIITADGANRFFDAAGNAKSLAEISGVLSEALAGQSKQQQLATLNTLFGADAIRAAAVLAEEGAVGINKLAEANRALSADEIAKKRLDNLNGSLEMLSGSVESLLIVVGSKATPVIRGFADGLNEVVDFLAAPPTGFFDPLIGPGEKLAEVVGNVGDLLGDLYDAGEPIARVMLGLGGAAVIAGLTVTADVLERVTGLMADHSDIVFAAAAAYVTFKGAMVAGAAWTAISTAVGAATTSVTYLTGAVQALAATKGVSTLTASVGVLQSSFVAATTGATGLALAVGAIGGAAALAYMQWKKWGDEGRKMAEGSIISGLRENLDGTADSYFKVAEASAEAARMARMDALNTTGFFNQDKKRQLEEGAAALEEFTEASVLSGARIQVGMSGLTASTGLSADALTAWGEKLNVDLLPALADGSLDFADFRGKVLDATNAAENGTPTTDALAESYAVLGDKTATSTEKLTAWKEALDAAMGVQKGIFDATTDFEQALASVGDTFGESWVNNLDASTEAGRNNREALSGAVDSAVALAAAYGETGNMEQAGIILQNTRDRLTEAGLAAGVSKDEMSAYLDELGLTPETVQTQIDLAGGDEAFWLAAGLNAELAGLDGKTVESFIKVKARFDSYTEKDWTNYGGGDKRPMFAGGITDYALGGIHAHVQRGERIRYAEPQTGGEAFIPRLGNAARSTAILAEAAGWYGLDVVAKDLAKRGRVVPMAMGGIAASMPAPVAAGSTRAPATFNTYTLDPSAASEETFRKWSWAMSEMG